MNGQQTAILSVVLFGGFAAAGLGAEPDPVEAVPFVVEM
jgi:hypothetical protein